MAVRPPRALAVIGAALTLSACAGGSALGGFMPLSATPGVHRGLSTVQVVAPQGRTAYLLRESLEDALATDQQAAPAYRLTYRVSQARAPRGLRVDNIADRYEVNTTVNYQLVSLPDRRKLTQGAVRVTVSADSADQPYAGVAAQADADKRSADEAAARIAVALGAYFAQPSSAQDVAPDASTSEDLGLRSVGTRLGAQDISRDPGDMSGTAPADVGPDGIRRIPTAP
jgi:LPS-assembly lipoprotein